jgi:hypothetical protein
MRDWPAGCAATRCARLVRTRRDAAWWIEGRFVPVLWPLAVSHRRTRAFLSVTASRAAAWPSRADCFAALAKTLRRRARCARGRPPCRIGCRAQPDRLGLSSCATARPMLIGFREGRHGSGVMNNVNRTGRGGAIRCAHRHPTPSAGALVRTHDNPVNAWSSGMISPGSRTGILYRCRPVPLTRAGHRSWHRP